MWHGVIVLLVCAAVYLPRLGTGGLTSTEGHRAIPGWGMLESGDWVLPRMFGQVYLRKPPGMSWAVGASSAVFGETEFAARLPSALAMMGMSLVAMVFGARWFGRGAGLAAGLATALTPWFWSSGRSAEIEALNNFGTCAAVLLVLELMVNREGRRWWGTLLVAALLGEAVVVAGVAKGPAGFAAIGSAVMVGFVCVGTDGAELRSVARVRAGLWLGMAMVLPAVVLGSLYIAVLGAAARVQRETGQAPVVQDVTDFLWSGSALTAGRVMRVLAVGPTALVAALPGSLGLLLVWGGKGQRTGTGETPVLPEQKRQRVGTGGTPALPGQKRQRTDTGETPVLPGQGMARAVAWTCLLSLAVLTVLGVSNPRYAMPSVSFVPVVVGYAWGRRHGPAEEPLTRGTGTGSTGLTQSRQTRGTIQTGGAIVTAGLLIAAGVWIGVLEPRERARSGREAGVAIGAVLPDGAMVWADHMVEARPEVLWYARQEAARLGKRIRPEWIPNLSRMLSLPRSGYLLLRTDPESGEVAAYRSAGFMDRLTKVWEGRVHKFGCALYRMDAERLRGGE